MSAQPSESADASEPEPVRIPITGELDLHTFRPAEVASLLEDYFADRFPFPKLDQITSPIMPGAMENAGADLYRDALIVMDEDAPIPQRPQFGIFRM